MPRKAVSVTLDADNLLWLRGQAGASSGRTLSAVLDHLIAEARTRGRVEAASIRSVVGSVTIAPDDPDLRGADDVLRKLFPARRPSASERRTHRAPARFRG